MGKQTNENSQARQEDYDDLTEQKSDFGLNVPKPSNGTKPSNSPKASTASNTLNFAGKGIGEKKSLLPLPGKIKNHSDASKLNLVLVSNYLLIIEGHLKN